MKYFIITWMIITNLLSGNLEYNRKDFTSFEEMHTYYKQNIEPKGYMHRCAVVTKLSEECNSYYWFKFEEIVYEDR